MYDFAYSHPRPSSKRRVVRFTELPNEIVLNTGLGNAHLGSLKNSAVKLTDRLDTTSSFYLAVNKPTQKIKLTFVPAEC